MMQKVFFSYSLIANCCRCCYYKDSCCHFPVLFLSLPTFQSNNTAVKGTQTAGWLLWPLFSILVLLWLFYCMTTVVAASTGPQCDCVHRPYMTVHHAATIPAVRLSDGTIRTRRTMMKNKAKFVVNNYPCRCDDDPTITWQKLMLMRSWRGEYQVQLWHHC